MSKLLEQKTIATAMRDPAATQVVQIKPKWFNFKNLRAVYNAIEKDPTGDMLSWYATAYNKFHFTGSSDSVATLKDLVMLGGVGRLKVFAKKLYKSYLIRTISNLAAKYAHVPAPETRTVLANYIDKMADINVDRNANNTKKAGKELLHDLKHNKPVGIKSFPKLDFVLGGGLYKSSLITIGAGTGVGKTAMAVNMAVKILQNDPEVTVDYFTEEMNAKEIVDRVISCLTGVSNFNLRNPYKRVHSKALKAKIAVVTKKLIKSNLNIYDHAYNINDISPIIRAHAGQMKENKYIAIVDYIGLVDVPHADRIPRHLQIGQVTRTLKMLTEDFSIPIIELSQLNRGVSHRESNKPELSDLNESGSVEQDSNVVILLYNDKNTKGVVHASIAKNRAGMTTEVLYKFIKNHMLFKEIGGQYEARN